MTRGRVIHGHKRKGAASGMYTIWSGIKARCNNPNAVAYPDYGGRGIRICERWSSSFENFLTDVPPRPPGASLDRFPDKDGNYEPGNVRWATAQQQAQNTRRNRLNPEMVRLIRRVRALGVSGADLSRYLGISQTLISGVVLRQSWTNVEDEVRDPTVDSLVALSTACKTAHDDAVRAGWTCDAEMLHDMGVDIANMISTHAKSSPLRNATGVDFVSKEQS